MLGGLAMNRLAILVVLSFVVGAILAPASRAQDVVPAAQLLPKATELGEGWVMLWGGDEQVTTTSPSLISASEGVYMGPAGARIAIAVDLVRDGPAAARDSWDIAGKFFDRLRYASTIDFAAERTLQDRPLVAGCAEMRRTSGGDNLLNLIKIGVDLCAADPNAIVITYVSGEWNGMSGTDAADKLVELVVSQVDVATPTAG
jgi:hypothetical protein